jgi:hypothetical protein
VADSRGYSDLRLKAGVSLSQTRFALANFCLSHFGGDGQYFADVIELCADTNQLQQALNTIRDEVRTRCPERLGALAECVREANDTDGDGAVAQTPGRPPSAPKPATQAPDEVPRPTLPARPSPRPQGGRAAADPLLLRPGISLAQARFTLTEFCLDHLGAKGQQLVDAIHGCGEVAELQRILTLVGNEVRASRPDDLGKLSESVREINESAD